MEDLILKITACAYGLAASCYGLWAVLKRDKLVFTARISLLLGIVFNVAGIVVRWSVAGRPPFSNLYESLILFALSITAVYLFLEFRYGLKAGGGIVCLLALLLLLYASRLDSSVRPLMPALRSNWLVTHVITCFVGYAAFTIAFVSSVLYLCSSRKKENDLLRQLDTITYKTTGFGFLFLTLGIMTGSIWANKAWGRYWGWDPKETWALITWLIYAFYLHMRVIRGWKGKSSSWVSVVGFAAVIFTYFGVSYLLPGLHSYMR